jgi:hypothetical protein
LQYSASNNRDLPACNAVPQTTATFPLAMQCLKQPRLKQLRPSCLQYSTSNNRDLPACNTVPQTTAPQTTATFLLAIQCLKQPRPSCLQYSASNNRELSTCNTVPQTTAPQTTATFLLAIQCLKQMRLCKTGTGFYTYYLQRNRFLQRATRFFQTALELTSVTLTSARDDPIKSFTQVTAQYSITQLLIVLI